MGSPDTLPKVEKTGSKELGQQGVVLPDPDLKVVSAGIQRARREAAKRRMTQVPEDDLPAYDH